MESFEEERIPPSVFVKFHLEEILSALREGRSIPKVNLKFEALLGQYLSGLLDLLYEEISDEKLQEIESEVNFGIEFTLTIASLLNEEMQELRKDYLEHPEKGQI